MKVLLNRILRNHCQRCNADMWDTELQPVDTTSTSGHFAEMESRRKSQPQVGKSGLTKSGKLPVAAPTSLQHFLAVLVMHICRKILLVNLRFKLGIYMVGVVVISLITDLLPLPQPAFATKAGLLNVIFARFGWGWTFLAVGAFVYITSYTYCCGRKELVQRHLYRLAVGTAWWYLCTSFFDYVEQQTGVCTQAGILIKAECRANDGIWIGFDISGHVFLMMYNLLLIGEEVKVIADWERINDFIREEEFQGLGRLKADELDKLKEIFNDYKPFVRMSTVGVTTLSLIWEATLIITILYFHNMPQKLIGAGFAAAGWFLTYHVWYKQDQVWSPGMPGEGLVKYGKRNV